MRSSIADIFKRPMSLDDLNRQALAIEIDLNIPVQRVKRVLKRIIASRGYSYK